MSARVSWRDHVRLFEKTQYIAKSRTSRVITRTFPPGIALTAQQNEMCKGPACHVTTYHIYFPFWQIWTKWYVTLLLRFSQLVTLPMYVYTGTRRIRLLFEHSFNLATSKLAYVLWYEHSSDDESGLVPLSSIQSANPSVYPISELSQPLVTTLDTDDSEKVWILNVPK